MPSVLRTAESVTDDWVLLSEIEHWVYCARQWAIIHYEQQFVDNDDTTRGHIEHRRVDTAGGEARHGVRTHWAIEVASEFHRMRGRCDRIVVEDGEFIPIEHKSGKRSHRAASIQLVAQAICLEEMIGAPVRHGQIYLAASNTFKDVEVADEALRAEVLHAVRDVRAARGESRRLPAPANDTRCPGCSMNEMCMPALVANPHRQRGLHGATWWP